VAVPREDPSVPVRRWPPTAAPQRIELPIGAVLGIFLGMEVVAYLAWNATVGRPFSVVGWEWDPTTTAVARQLLANTAIQLVLWFVVLAALGWGTAAGLGVGRVSLWGMVPLALFWAAALMAAGLTNVFSKGGGFIALAVVGVFLAALNEEIAFRGFLFHGLARRLDATVAVLIGSSLFALAHLPVEMGRHHPPPVIIGALIGHFCFGVVMCKIRAETEAVWMPAGVHALYNLTTVGIAIWAYPEGQAPTAFLLLKLGLDVAGLFLTLGLGLRPFWQELRANVAIVSKIRATARGPSDAPADADPGPDAAAHPGHVGEPSRTSPFARFTREAQTAIVLAQAEAVTQGDPAIGTEHLLLGLVADRDGVPARALRRIGISLRVSPAPDPSGDAGAPAPLVPFTRRAKLAFVVAIREADRSGSGAIGPEHLLLGTLGARDGGAVRVLRRLGASPDQVRRSVLEVASWRTERDAGEPAGVDRDPPH
jgi:membrane protease YdiL (CAAX protease family)